MPPDRTRARITVAVATVDRPERLERCVRALLSGSLRPAELIIVDQSSDDRTAYVVANAGWDQYTSVRYLRQARRGLAASRNVAIAQSTQPIVAFTDDDCVPAPAWLAALVAAFGGADQPDLVTGRVLPLETEDAGMYAVASRTSLARTMFRGRAIPWAVGTGGNAAVRREWLERIDGFDERLGTGSPGQSAEDMDLFYRLLRAGATVRYEPDAVVFHERKDRNGMGSRAPSYGFGMGAFCALSARQRDPYALWIALRWYVDRGRMVAAACCRRQWWRVGDELRMMRGAVRGIGYGLRSSSAEPSRPVVTSEGLTTSGSTR
jgi:GT2 family glycosyltransferase